MQRIPCQRDYKTMEGHYLLVVGFQQELIQSKLFGYTRHTSLGWLHARWPTKAQMKFRGTLEEIEVSSTDTYCIGNLTSQCVIDLHIPPTILHHMPDECPRWRWLWTTTAEFKHCKNVTEKNITLFLRKYFTNFAHSHQRTFLISGT